MPATSRLRSEGAWAWLAAAVSLVAAGNLVDSRTLVPDSLYDLYDARRILHDGLPHHNLATVSAHGAATVDQQWLGHLLYYGAWQVGGYQALATLSAALITGGYAILGLLMLRRGVPPVRMFAWTVAAFVVCLGNNSVEAQSFGFLFFAVTLYLLVTDDGPSAPRPRTWLVAPVLVLWANTHGSVVLGAAVVWWFAAVRTASAWRRHDRGVALAYLVLAVLAAAACVCTPYGTQTIGYYLAFASRQRFLAGYILAFHSPSPGYQLSWAFFVVAAATAATTVLAWRRGARPDLSLGGLSVVLFCFAMTAVRYQIWFGFAGSLLAADSMARASGTGVAALGAAFRRVIAGVLAAAAAVCLGALAATPDRVLESGFPAKAMDVAANLAARNPAARILADDWSGTPMLWLHPALFGRVGFDIRVEQYTPVQLRDYFDFLEIRGPHWSSLASEYTIIVVSRKHYPRLASELSSLPGWRVVHDDQEGVVAMRC